MRSPWSTRAVLLSVGALFVYVTLATFAFALLPPHPDSQPVGEFPSLPFVKALVRWDSGWYAAIAEKGYWYTAGAQSPVAFFPAYPLAIRALNWLGMHSFLAGILISAVCGPLALWLFYLWARRLASEAEAFSAAVLLAVYPFAFYLFGVMYAEALFLALVIPAFLSLERGNLWLATLFGALATFCRPIAPAVVVGLVLRQVELRRQRGEPVRAVDFLPVLSAVGMAAYMFFLWREFGDPLAFAKVQAAPGWDHPPGWRTWLKVQWFETMFPRVRPDIGFRLALHAALTLGALALAWPMRKRLGWGYAAYVALAVAIPAVNMKDFHGMGRYVLAAFPCLLMASLLIGERPKLRRAAWALSAACALWFVTYFARGGWAA